MKKLFHTLCASALVAAAALATTVQAAELHVMSSGGFTAAYKLLGPQFEAHTGNTLDTALGPSMGKSAEAIPNRLARGEPADAVIMVGYALDDLIRQGKVIAGSRVELADSRIGMVVRAGAPTPTSARPTASSRCCAANRSRTRTARAASIERSCSRSSASRTRSNRRRR
jgi:molybdate transport system substrate-binding protein